MVKFPKDLTGERFGLLVVVSRAPNKIFDDGRYCSQWNCDCDCGNSVVVTGQALQAKTRKSCGCLTEKKANKLEGKTFGRLKVLCKTENKVYPNGDSRTQWTCLCECGNITDVVGKILLNGGVQSCGCLRTPSLVGKQFGKLTVIDQYVPEGGLTTVCECICDCGETAIVRFSRLIDENGTRSCGCLRSESKITHGLTRVGSKRTGKTETRAFGIWAGMIRRCLVPESDSYSKYGAKGITVTERWLDFDNFLEDMGEPPDGLSLDRINNKLGYSKENCRWATSKEQARNTSSNHLVTYNGLTLSVAEWADRPESNGLPYKTLLNRFNKGWSAEDAFGVPLNQRRKRYGKTSKDT